MATPAADSKATALADELKEYALTLPPTAFPKNFFCAICSQLALDSWKLLCCNKSICSSCHDKLEFPTTCPLCDHSPLEADLCTVNKNLRNTMRAWLQKQKKKEEAKSASQPPTPVVAAPAAPDMTQTQAEESDKPVQSVEAVPKTEQAEDRLQTPPEGQEGQVEQSADAPISQSKEGTTAPDANDEQKPQDADTSIEPPAGQETTDAPQNGEDASSEGMYGNNMSNMNGMPGQFGYGFTPNQANFNGMGFNGMNPMNGMPNMMGNMGWNNMNPMDFNNMNMPNGMYGGFGGNMGMSGMNDMSAMNMMGYGGGYGNGWQGGMNNGGYGNFNDFNPMGGYNQSGAQFPNQMMNQFPKNNFQNQNRFHSNGTAFSQKNNRRGSHGNFGNQNNGPGFQQNAHSRPGSRSGPSQNRDGESPAGDADAAPETKVNGDQADASAGPAQEGKDEVEDASKPAMSPTVITEGEADATNELTRAADDDSNDGPKLAGLNHIQTVDSVEPDSMNYSQPMMNNAMQFNQGYPQGMMNDFSGQGLMGGAYGSNMGYDQHQHHGHAGGFNAAYGAATVLTGEPRGVGVEGAPTGPRAMREGRPNTGFSSRPHHTRYNSQAQTPSVAPSQDAVPGSPRRGRESPERDETLRTKDKSPSRSMSRSRREDERDNQKERSRSPDRESKQKRRDRSVTPVSQEDPDRRRDRRHHRSSRYEDRDDRDDERYADYDDRYRDARDERGDRTRSQSVESKHRSRRDKDKHRSSRSHRERSREHRRRHRSRSPNDRYEDEDAYDNGADLPSESSSRRKHRGDKDKYRDRERDRSRDRDRDRDRRDKRDRDYENDYEYEEKDRAREKDRDRKRSRRDYDEEEERDYVEEKHRSSRRSRKERDRERDREDRHKDTDQPSQIAASPPLNAPTGPSADGFSIRGISKSKRTESISKPMAPPPTGPRNFQPPKGPAADRDKSRDHRHRRNSSVGSLPPTTPTTPSAPASASTTDHNHYAADREKHIKERVEQNQRDKLISSVHGRATGRSDSTTSTSNNNTTSSRPSLSSKRSRDDFDREDEREDRRDRGDKEKEKERDVSIPTGPAAHRDKRRKSGDNAIANLFTAGLRKRAGESGRGRRGGVRNEGDGERELERVERERERRW